jgi:hypothetical protein
MARPSTPRSKTMPKKRNYAVTTDANLNSVLQDQLATLRGRMVGAAEKHSLPKRFRARPHADIPAFIVTDTATGRTTTISLCSYGDIRQALHELFSDNFASEGKP